MTFGGWKRVVAMLAFCGTGSASPLLYTFGGDFVTQFTGAPTSLNQMDPASAASVTNILTPVGDGSIGFNGGLVGAGGLLYAIGNDSLGNATLYSFGTNGQGLTAVSSNFNSAGDAASFGFYNGLAASGGVFYAIGNDGIGGQEALFQIGNGTATELQLLNTFGGTYSGLAWDPALNGFYAIIAGASAGELQGDLLVSFLLGGPVGVTAQFSLLDGADSGTHLGGLADVGGGVLYDIYTNPNTFTGELERLNVSGPVAANTLYDSGVPLAQNAGVAFIPSEVPEPGSLGAAGLALILALRLRRR